MKTEIINNFINGLQENTAFTITDTSKLRKLLNDYEEYRQSKVKENELLHSVSESFDSLIDRLEIASNIKHPNRPYTPEFKKSVALMWKGKESELLTQVKKLEKEVNVC